MTLPTDTFTRDVLDVVAYHMEQVATVARECATKTDGSHPPAWFDGYATAMEDFATALRIRSGTDNVTPIKGNP